VRVTVEVDDVVLLLVEDDGVGIPESPVAGNGLANMADRAEGLGGTVQLEARSLGGSRVTWRVPLA